MSWYRAPLWDLRPNITSCRNVAVWNLRSCFYGTPSLTRGRVCNLQYNHPMARAAQNRNHILLFHLRFPQPGGPSFRIYIPHEQSGPVIPPGHWIKVEVTLRQSVSQLVSQSVSQSVSLGIKYLCGTCDQIVFPVGMLLSKICGLVSVGRPLWGEDGSAICNVITQWSESLRTRNHTLLSHLRLPQSGGPGSCIYIPQEQGYYFLK
jgi:hypothetical protein